MFACRFTTRLHETTYDVLSNAMMISVIIVAHVLVVHIIIIFSFIFPKAKQEIIMTISWFQF